MNQSELLDIEWREVDTPYWKAKGVDYASMAVASIPNRGLEGIGVDPGRNFGLCFVGGENIAVLYGTMPKEEELWRYGITAFRMMNKVVGENYEFPVAVEGPSFGSKFGQPALESIRFGFALGLVELGAKVDVVPPATIRAQVLGHGHNKAPDFWPSLNENAADAVAAAFYAAGLRREGEAQKWPP